MGYGVVKSPVFLPGQYKPRLLELSMMFDRREARGGHDAMEMVYQDQHLLATVSRASLPFPDVMLLFFARTSMWLKMTRRSSSAGP
jgi:hypothetical protein